MSVYALKGVVQHYAWGGNRFIPNLLKVENTTDVPYAEYWMGTHPKGPSKVKTAKGDLLLSDLINLEPSKKLGFFPAIKFNNRLPFLFKVLDVKKMLSIQAHPIKAEAEKGYKRENEEGIALDAPNRTYRDDNHKPEVMVALTDFWLLHGFRPTDEIQEVLEIPEFQSLVSYFQNTDIFQIYKAIMEMPQERVNDVLAPLWDRLKPLYDKGKLEKKTPDYWAALAFCDYTQNGQYDRGIFSIYLFNLVHLKKGEGIFQQAGVPHAYLEGGNMELMANSDNVFRGGLTQKHIDVPELLKHLVFDPVYPIRLSGTSVSPLEKIFKTPAPDFELSQLTISQRDTYRFTNPKSAEILILMEGTATVHAENKYLHLSSGACFFVEAGTSYTITTSENCQLFKAKVP